MALVRKHSKQGTAFVNNCSKSTTVQQTFYSALVYRVRPLSMKEGVGEAKEKMRLQEAMSHCSQITIVTISVLECRPYHQHAAN